MVPEGLGKNFEAIKQVHRVLKKLERVFLRNEVLEKLLKR
jgi:hypothetical protein